MYFLNNILMQVLFLLKKISFYAKIFYKQYKQIIIIVINEIQEKHGKIEVLFFCMCVCVSCDDDDWLDWYRGKLKVLRRGTKKFQDLSSTHKHTHIYKHLYIQQEK